MKKIRLAYFVSHPIQYQSPLLRLIAASEVIDLKVFFLSDFSVRAYYDTAFGQSFRWDVPMTDGYAWELAPRWGTGKSSMPRRWLPLRGVRRCLAEGRFDAIWVHGWFHVGLYQAVRAANSLGLPVLLRGESIFEENPPRGLRRRLRNAFCRALFQRIAGFLCIGTSNRRFYSSFDTPASKLFSMPYAVDNGFFQRRAQEAGARREVLRAELGLAPGRPVILFAAKFIPVKGAADLLRAFGRLRANAASSPARNPYLLLVGDGPLRPELQALADEVGGDVRFLGFHNQSELPPLYDLCDVFTLPSHFEPWGLVVNEAMNAAKPVIVSDKVGAGVDLVRPGVNGWVYPAGNLEALVECMREAFDGRDLGAMGQQSLTRINTWDYRADLVGLMSALNCVLRLPA